MSAFATFKKKEQSKVPNSQYIKTENEPSKEDKPKETGQPTASPDKPEAA